MTDGDLLLAAILDNPAEDTPRLVYADWLDEQGKGERAEFIRVQVELANWRGDGSRCPVCEWPLADRDCACRPDDCAYRPPDDSEARRTWLPRQQQFQGLRARERELWNRLDVTFHKPFCRFAPGSVTTTIDPNWKPAGHARFFVSRGFVSSVTLDCASFLKHAGAIFASHPVTRVTLSDREPQKGKRNGRALFWWILASNTQPLNHPTYIPRCLWTDELSVTYGQMGTRELAHAALSAACVAHGTALRQRAKQSLTP